MTYTVLITGASRGIGLEFAKQYAQQGWHVLASCRRPTLATKLLKLQEEYPNIKIFGLDVSQPQGASIDLLINNAGIAGEKSWEIGDTGWENLQNVFQVNTFAPLKIIEAVLENIAQSTLKQVVLISSSMGSIADNKLGRAYAYRGSKAAANMIMKSLSIDLAERGIRILTLCPGWVKTDLGGKNAEITPEESVNGMRKMIATIGREKTGGFYNYKGEEIPW